MLIFINIIFLNTIISIDLLSSQYVPGKKIYERTKKCLEKLETLTFIFNWRPLEETVCPSSLAKYFVYLNYNVDVCKPKRSLKTLYAVDVPDIDFNSPDNMYEFIEWIGMIGFGANTKEHEEYISIYFTPEPNRYYGQTKYLEWSGFYAPDQIINLIDKLRYFIKEEKKPWAAVYVQGFSDSPINWKENENHYYTNGDNGYLIIFNPKDEYIMSTLQCSNKYYK